MAIAAIACATVLGCSAIKAETAASAAAPRLTSAKIPVTVAKPQLKAVQGALSLNGTVHTATEVQVVAETPGKVMQVFFEVGSRVEKGERLAQIDDELKQASFETAQASYDKSKADWARAQDLFAQKVISDADRQGIKLAFTSSNSQLIMARRDLDNAKVSAAQGGVVTKKSVSVGSMLMPGSPVAFIIDTDNLRLTVQVGEREILKIRKGMAVEVLSDLYPGRLFSGVIASISPKGDAALSFPVEIDLKTPASRPLYDGMSAKARINLGEHRILAIPRSSIVGSYQKPQAYVVHDGVARLVDLTAGGEFGTDLEILGGLAETDDLVVDGQNNLYDGAAIVVAGAVSQ